MKIQYLYKQEILKSYFTLFKKNLGCNLNAPADRLQINVDLQSYNSLILHTTNTNNI